MLSGGETVRGGFKVAYTPGHASHHVSYLHDGTAFVGDVGGVRITPTSMTIPPTPPPDIDVEAWHESIRVIRAWRPQRLAITHFGDKRGRRRSTRRARPPAGRVVRAGARDGDRERFIETVQQEILRDGSPEQAVTYQQAAPVEQLYAGYERYWCKTRESQGGQWRRSPLCWRPMSLTVELPRTGLPGSGLSGLWRVVVLNDEYNTFDHVAETLARVVPGV